MESSMTSKENGYISSLILGQLSVAGEHETEFATAPRT